MTTTTIFANVIWPAAFLESRLLSMWIIAAGLVIEYLLLWLVTPLGAGRSAAADVLMNAASTLLGIVLIPLAGIVWEVGPGSLIHGLFGIGTFNPGTWAATFCMAVLINAALESAVLRLCFAQPSARGLFWWLCLANALSVGLALASFLVYPPRV